MIHSLTVLLAYFRFTTKLSSSYSVGIIIMIFTFWVVLWFFIKSFFCNNFDSASSFFCKDFKRWRELEWLRRFYFSSNRRLLSSLVSPWFGYLKPFRDLERLWSDLSMERVLLLLLYRISLKVKFDESSWFEELRLSYHVKWRLP